MGLTDIGRLVSPVGEEQLFVFLLVENPPHLAGVLRGDGDPNKRHKVDDMKTKCEA